MESKSDLFLQTYNGNYIRTLNRDELEELKTRISSSQEFKDGEKITLLRLIDSRPYSLPRTIWGPNHFYVARKNGMNIYLFGEIHIGNERQILNNCISSIGSVHAPPDFKKFVDVLKDLETNGKCFFDVFTEFSYIKESRRTEIINYEILKSYTMNSIIDKYKHCLTRNRRDNHCNNFRFHYCDVRTFLYTLFDFFQYPQFQTIQMLLQYFANKPFQQNLFRDFANYDSNPWVFHSFILDNPIVKRQLEKSYLKNHIKKYIAFMISSYIAPATDIIFAFKIFNEVINLNIAHDLSLVFSMYSKIQSFFYYLLALSMDTYLLARLFKVYDRSKDVDYRGPDKTYNAIIYAGSMHIKNIKNFLKLGLEFQIDDVYIPLNEASSCIQIKEDKRATILNYRPVVSPSPFSDTPEHFLYIENAFDYSRYLREEKIERPIYSPEYIPDLIYREPPRPQPPISEFKRYPFYTRLLDDTESGSSEAERGVHFK